MQLMQWKRSVVIFFLVLSACASGTDQQRLRVMVFNIHAGKDAAAVDNLQRVADLINATDADLVLLQEVDRKTRRSGDVDQLAELMRLTRRHGAFGKSLDYQGGEYGIAILSRWPITAQATIPLQVEPPQPRAGGSVEPRVALVVDTRTLRVINTHLDASREEGYRLQEIERLLPEIRKRAPQLTGGDFNAEPQSTVHQRMIGAGLRDSWVECGKGASLTYPAGTPVKRIDYLFLSEGSGCSEATVLDTTASDHRPVLIDVTLRPPSLAP